MPNLDAEIRTLKNSDGTLIIYPQTLTEGVYSPLLETSVEDLLENKIMYLDEDQLVTGIIEFDEDIIGNLAGNAVTATYADEAGYATNDSNGDDISDTYVHRAGDTLTGSLLWNNSDNQEFHLSWMENNYNVDLGWDYNNNYGAGIGLRSSLRTNEPGYFVLYARDGTNATSLSGSPAGYLKWQGCLSITPKSNQSSWNEGIRLHAAPDNYATITFCDSANTTDSGTSTNTWSFSNNEGTFYINQNGSSAAQRQRIMGTATGWTFGNTTINDYALNAESLHVGGTTFMNNLLTMYRETSIANNYYAGIEFRVKQTDNNTTATGGIIRAYDDHDAAANGLNLVIGGTSNLIIGSGESASACYTTDIKDSSSEQTYITSDNSIYFHTNCQTYANKITTLTLSGNTATLAANAQIARTGKSVSWIQGRDGAMLRQTSYTGYNPILSIKTTNGSWQMGPYSNDILYFSYTTDANYSANSNTDNHAVNIRPDGKLYGAVWNDYVEYREGDSIEPGYVMVETGYDTIKKSNERMEAFAGVSSDTFGFAIGETDKAKTPIAVAGRVLVYPLRSRDEYKPGDCVCAAASGKVDIMTREEIQKYPDRIVGIVSSVPQYDTWGESNVPVNGRIWIKVK